MALAVAWEGYKAIATALELTNPVRPDNITMPHVWDIIGALFEPVQRGTHPSGRSAHIEIDLRGLVRLRSGPAGEAVWKINIG